MSDIRSTVLYGSALDTLEVLLSGLLGEGSYALPSAPTGEALRATLAVSGPAPGVGTPVDLEDPDGTPIARLEVTGVEPASDGTTWIAGDVVQVRALEHGPRIPRLTAGTSFDGRVVALFSGRLSPADVLRSHLEAGGRPLDYVFVGPSSHATTTTGIAQLEGCASALPDSRVWFLPEGHLLGAEDHVLRIAQRLGATDLLDFRGREHDAEQGAVVVFTGLSGSGKSTLARRLVDHLHLESDRVPVLLDGDDVRRQLSSELGFSAADRDRNLQRIAWVGARVAEAGGIAVCAPIAPFASSRAEMRKKAEPHSTFFLVHVATPLAVAEARDRKGLYAKARAGQIKDFTGIDSPYEAPTDADVVVDTSTASVDDCVSAVVAGLRARGVIPGAAPLASLGR